MAAEFWMRDGGGTPRKAKEVWMRDSGGIAHKAKEIWFRGSDGVPNKVYSGDTVVVNLTNGTYGGDPFESLVFNSSGQLTSTALGIITGQWAVDSPTPISGTQAANYEILFTYVSGVNGSSGSSKTGGASTGGNAYGVWYTLNSNPHRSISAYAGSISGSGSGTCTFNAQIRQVGTATILASANFQIIASSL